MLQEVGEASNSGRCGRPAPPSSTFEEVTREETPRDTELEAAAREIARSPGCDQLRDLLQAVPSADLFHSRTEGSACAEVHSGDEELRDILERLSIRESGVRYHFKGRIAQGGQGIVLRVWDADLRRELAMKVVLGEGHLERESGEGSPRVDSKALSRFLDEAQVTSQLDHPGIVPVHEVGLDP
ncbi:MAG: hypothetical protein AAF354_12675, partial [Pseudomonadota bacterium]